MPLQPPLSQLEPGSFRDRNNRVFYYEDQVFRGLSQTALVEWDKLWTTKFFPKYMQAGHIIQTQQVGNVEDMDPSIAQGWAGILWHEKVPFISYPYEWPFSMLKDAALLQLELLLNALEEGMILKDATAYNFQWFGVSPVFIDITSFEALRQGEPWVGYRQFCQLFLFPLMLQAYRNVPYQPWLRGSIDGITPKDCLNLIRTRDLLKPGAFFHVYLQAKMEALVDQKKAKKSDLVDAGFSARMIQANAMRLEQIVAKLEWKQSQSVWSDYTRQNSYTDTEQEAKAAFVREVVQSKPWQLVWDLGCNTGKFSRIAALNANYVVAMDSDQLVVEMLYQDLRREQNLKILPLVNNLADSSPDWGWRGLERKSLPQRGKPDLTLCLALIHHIVISANIPLKEFVEWLADLKTALVIEFVTKDDPMVKLLLQNKKDNYEDYTLEFFEACLQQRFELQHSQILEGNTRKLYYAAPKTPIKINIAS